MQRQSRFVSTCHVNRNLFRGYVASRLAMAQNLHMHGFIKQEPLGFTCINWQGFAAGLVESSL